VLDAYPSCRFGKSVALRTASVIERAGTFATCPDVLYKRDLFLADLGTPDLEHNVIDVDKAIARWNDVAADLPTIWGSRANEIVGAIADPTDPIRREYFAHEAGHLIGVDVDAKAAGGYFRLHGRLCWPLVYLEEVRADLHAMAVAAEAYSPTDASRVFYYHLATRFGTHHHRSVGRAAPFGLVPYFMFVALHDVDLLRVVRDNGASRLSLTATCVAEVVSGMRACGSWTEERITAPELDSASPLDLALVGARHVRACLDRDDLVSAFTSVLGPIT
jgi:hypothetical protein